MKRQSVRKSLIIGTAVLLAFGMLLGSCESPTDNSDDSGSKSAGSFTGIYSGFVIDSITGQAIPGVTVSIGGRSTTTDDAGSYVIKDIPVGKHVVGFKKDGYRFVSQDGAEVDVQTYKNADPFGEWKWIEDDVAGKLLALDDWANGLDAVNTLTFTVDNGASITATQDGSIFRYEQVRNDTAWEYEYPLFVTTMAPLNASFKGSIKLIEAQYNDRLNVTINPKNAADVEVYFTDTTSVAYTETEPNPDAAVLPPAPAVPVYPQYGPVKTSADGTFEITGLPVGATLTLSAVGTIQDNHYYKGTSVYQRNANNFSVVSGLTTKNGTENLGEFYLFSEGDFAFISAYNTGTVLAPIVPVIAHGEYGSVSLTFSKAINAEKFTAKFSDGSNPEIDLAAEWDVAKTTVTLKPAAGKSPYGYTLPRFPYSNGTNPAGYLSITGYAEDGSQIFADTTVDTNGIPVYTTEGIKLVNVDANPEAATVPARTIAVKPETIAIKLTFSKEVDPVNSIFAWGNTDSHFNLGTDIKEVYVYTDLLTYTAKKLTYTVVSAADSEDRVTAVTIDGDFAKLKPARNLTLLSTNLYNPRKPGFASGTDKYFTPGNSMTLTFNTPIPQPQALEVSAILTGGGSTYTTSSDPKEISWSTSGNTLTLSLSNGTTMSLDTSYSLTVVVKTAGSEIFNTASYMLQPNDENDIFATDGSSRLIFTTKK